MENQANSPLVAAEYPELFFGLIGAAGTDLRTVSAVLRENLQRVGYQTEFVKATAVLQDLPPYRSLREQKFTSDAERTHKFMDAGNQLRQRTERKDVMAMLCVGEIRNKRRVRNENASEADAPNRPLKAVAFIIYSLKTPQEVDLLKAVYGPAFYVISAYAPRDRRLKSVAEKLKSDAQAADVEGYLEPARKLINRDEKESINYGQNVRGCFPRGDVFVDASRPERIKAGIERFIELIFGNSFITPTKDEFAMFHAYSAALRSAELGRQVGAVIASKHGDIIAVGCNEVPKAEGGLYWEGDEPDCRDFKLGSDSSDKNRQEIVFELISTLRENKWLNPAKAGKRATKSITRELLDKNKLGNLRHTRIMNVIEFGRAVHAEMAALIDAARRGAKVTQSTMYCTTFPCHLCARHIIAAGITRLVYVEPYPKSQALEMYKDSMVVDCEGLKIGFVNFQPFVGVAPKLYDFVFKMTNDRKNEETGEVVYWSIENAQPKLEIYSPSYIFHEENVLGYDLSEGLKQAKISLAKH